MDKYKVTIERWVNADSVEGARYTVINMLLQALLSPIEGVRERELASWVTEEES